MGRPSDYTTEIADEICHRIADGWSLRKICEDKEMPDRRTVMRWMDAHLDFASKYTRARAMQADVLDDEMQDITLRTIEGELDPNAARVALANMQWRAAKLAPKRYGDQIAIQHSGEVRATIGGADA